MTRPRVVVACDLPAAGLELLREHFVIEQDCGGSNDGSLLARVAGAAAIVADPSVHVDDTLLEAAGASLAVVANYAVGYDNVDLAAVRARGIRFTNTPDVVTDATAELTVGLMLATARRIAEGDALVRRGEWPPEPDMLGRGLVGATVGVVGFGRIGRRVAALLQGFDVRVLCTGRDSTAVAHGARPRELAALLAESDFVTLHVPLTPETRHLIDGGALSTMKPSAILVNTSRGAVVDTMALIEALREGRLAGAGLDVYEDEPRVSAELRALPNTVLLPHVGSATGPTRDAMARLVADNVIAVIQGHEPPTAVI
jgi:glyoxylate reductase